MQLDEWAAAIDALADDLQAVTATPDLFGTPRGTYAQDLLAVPLEEPTWAGEHIMERVVFDSAKFVSIAIQHGRGMAALLRGREVHASPWPILRAQLEAAGRLSWIIEPHDDGVGLGPRRRAARYFMDVFCSVCYLRAAFKAANSPNASEAKRIRNKLANEIMRLFGVELCWQGDNPEQTWMIGNDSYVGLGKATRLFAKHAMSQGSPDLYPMLSGFSHPSPLFQQQLLVEDADHLSGLRTTEWFLDLADVHWQCTLTSVFMYRATSVMVSYLGGPWQDLDQAMDNCQSVIGDTP